MVRHLVDADLGQVGLSENHRMGRVAVDDGTDVRVGQRLDVLRILLGERYVVTLVHESLGGLFADTAAPRLTNR